MQTIFDPVVDQIIKLVAEQVHAARKSCEGPDVTVRFVFSRSASKLIYSPVSSSYRRSERLSIPSPPTRRMVSKAPHPHGRTEAQVRTHRVDAYITDLSNSKLGRCRQRRSSPRRGARDSRA